MTRRRALLVVVPLATERGAREAEAATRRTEELRRAEELQRKATPTPPPPLDESVVEGLRGKHLEEPPKR